MNTHEALSNMYDAQEESYMDVELPSLVATKLGFVLNTVHPLPCCDATTHALRLS
eukprot:c44011_g1_i1 orf=80-244(+)